MSTFSFITDVIHFTWISYFIIAHLSHQFIFSYLILYLLSFLHLLSVCPTRRYSRVPVYRGDVDNIVGVVYSKDLLEVRYCCVCCYSLSLSVYKVNYIYCNRLSSCVTAINNHHFLYFPFLSIEVHPFIVSYLYLTLTISALPLSLSLSLFLCIPSTGLWQGLDG